MAYYNRMADLTIRDMARLHQAGQRLIALANAISSTGLAGKPALLRLLAEVHADIETIFHKGVVGLANHVRRGKAPRVGDDPEFSAHVVEVMQAEAAKHQPAQTVGEAPNAGGAAAVDVSMSAAPEMADAATETGPGAIVMPESSAR